MIKLMDSEDEEISGARVSFIEPSSPADRGGVEVGMSVLKVDGKTLHDRLDWLWESDGLDMTLLVDDHDSLRVLSLSRDPGEPWGLDFGQDLFDGMHLCCNNCTFCFMKMLPRGLRGSLYKRDDDFRLSFTQGNFVTLTNVTDEEVDRIIEQRISPLHVSFHAISPQIRRKLIGRNAPHGIEVLERLLANGIEVHAQVVLVPHVNDGEELKATLRYLKRFDSLLTCGIVPLGYTKYQDAFSASFDDAETALPVIELVNEENECDETHPASPRLFAADAFYLKAGVPIPKSSYYGDFELYEDGIGMVRWAIDDFGTLGQLDREQFAKLKACGTQEGTDKPHEDVFADVITLSGEAFAPILDYLINRSPLAGLVEVAAVRNTFFGGNVDVTGLLCGCDLVAEIRRRVSAATGSAAFLIPSCVFNADGYTLDDYTIGDIVERSGQRCIVVSCTAIGLVEAFMSIRS